MKRYLICLIVFFVSVSLTYAQETPPAGVNTNPIITLDFSQGSPSPDKIFPFEKSFTLHLKGIQPLVDHIVIRIQINRSAIAQFKKDKNSGTSDSTDDLVLEWTRKDGDASRTEDNIYAAAQLIYNAEYILKISSYSKKDLTSVQKSALSDALKDDPDIARVVNQLAQAKRSTASKVLVDYKDQIIVQAGKAIARLDRSYIYTAPESLPILSDLMTFHTKLINMEDKIKYVEDNSKSPADQIKRLRESYSAIDWGHLSTTAQAYKDFLKLVDDLTAAEPSTHVTHATVLANLGDLKSGVKEAVDARDSLVKTLSDRAITPYTYTTSATNTTYDPKFENNAQAYITLDVGMAGVARIDRVLFYSGIDIFLRPIDKTIPLEWYTGWEKFRTRACFVLGVSLTSIEKENVRKGIIGDKALVLGAGYRIWSFLKINAGVFAHYRYNQNPIIDPERYHLSTSPFISISIDADVKKIFSAFGSGFSN